MEIPNRDEEAPGDERGPAAKTRRKRPRLVVSQHPDRHLPISDRERFYEKTRRIANGCLVWTAATTKSGHGKFVLKGKTMIAHRVAWFFEYGEILSPDQLLLHSCSTAACVEVSHLRIGTHAENMADRAAAGHYNTSRGLNNPFGRFTDAEIDRMREMIAAGISNSSVAAAFQCSSSHARLVAAGKVRTRPTSEPSAAVLAERERLAKAQARRTRASQITGSVHPDDEVDGEEWRPTAYEGYVVSSLGRVRGRNMTVLKPYINAAGYAIVFCGKDNPRGVHILVCEAWHGPRPSENVHAAHTNGNSLDNTPQNLRWATPLENGHDRVLHGTPPRGISNANAKLTPEKARAIRAQFPGPRGTINRLVREYGVTKTAITNIRDNITWRD